MPRRPRADDPAASRRPPCPRLWGLRRALAAAASLALLGACATAPTPDRDAVREVAGLIAIGGTDHAVTWRLPAGQRIGLAVVQPGFTRACRHLGGLQQAMALRGVVTLCVDASMAGGNPRLADALAELLVDGLSTPDGQAAPARWLVAGHSAGAVFAARLGAALADRAPHRLAGAVLLDPVAVDGWAADLSMLSGAGLRPVRTISAAAGPCNAHRNADAAWRRVRDEAAAGGRAAFVGVQGLQGSTHLDAEGPDTDLLAWAACRQGWPRPAHVQVLRTLAAGWAESFLRGGTGAVTAGATDLEPGGAAFESMRQAGLIDELR